MAPDPLAPLADPVADALVADPAAWAPGASAFLRGAAVVLDVRGFSALAEARAADGRAGAEAVAVALDRFWEPMVDAVRRGGGGVLGFAGDAMAAFVADAPRAPGGRRALALAGRLCALAARAAGDGEGLAVRLGVAEGTLALVACATGDGVRVVPAGDALAAADAAQRQAAAGGIATPAGPAAAPAWRTLRDGARPRASRAAAAAARLQLEAAVAARLDVGGREGLAEHRRIVALFAVLPGVDPCAVAPVRAAAERVAAAAHAHAGALLHLEASDAGLRALVVFGAPVAREDDVARALACADALRGAGAACGVAAGVAWCGAAGSPARWTYTAIGDVVNVAARLAGEARPGTALVADGCAAPPGLRLGPVRRLALRGRAGRVDARPLLAGRARPAAVAAPAAGAIVGRDAELARLGRLAVAARRGRGAGVVVEGPAGSGTSTLVAAAAARAAAAGARVVVGRASPPHARAGELAALGPPLRALLDLPADADGAALAHALAPLPGTAAPERRALLLAPILGVAVGEAGGDAGLAGEEAEAARAGLVVDVLAAACARGPVVLVLEDAHWLPLPARALVGAVARAARDLPLLVLVASREPLALPAAAAPVRLGPLADDVVAGLVRAAFAARLGAAHAVADDLVAAIVARAGGSPLVAGELAALVVDRGLDPAVDRLPADVPERIEDIVLARLDALPPAARQAVQAASVVGVEVRGPLLAAALGRRDVAGARRALAPAVRAGLLVPAGTDAWRFPRGPVRDAVHGSLARAARGPAHLRVARRLAAAAPADAEAVARHLRETDDAAARRLWLPRAADAAGARYAHAARAGFLRDLVPLLAGRRRVHAELALAEAEGRAGAWDAAEALLDDLLGRARGADAARARLALGGLLLDRGELERAAVLLDDAVHAFARLRDPDGRGRALGRLAVARFRAGDYAAARRLADRRLRAARRAGDGAGEVEALDARGIARWAAGDVAGARADLAAGLALARARARPDEVLVLANDLAGALWEDGRGEEARARLAEAIAAAEAAGAVALRAVMEANAGELALAAGDAPGALARYATSARLAARTGDRPNLANALGGAGRASAALGDAAGARALLGRALVLLRGTGDDYLGAELREVLAGLPAADGAPRAEAVALLRLAGRGRV